MQILNFVPLLIWSLAFLWLSSMHQQKVVMLGGKYNSADDTILYLVGCSFWFLVGVFSCA